MPQYYEAYEQRYKAIHEKGYSWASDKSTPIVLGKLKEYNIGKNDPVLEIGCGEGRDAVPVLREGYSLLATDISEEAIRYCKEKFPAFADSFRVMDCLSHSGTEKYRFIYAVAVVHMLVRDCDRDGFYRFIHDHLSDDGIALVCSMGDGGTEFSTDINDAFKLKERNHFSGKVMVSGTSCRMVNFRTFTEEIGRNGLGIIEQGLTSALPDFDSMLYAVVSSGRRAPV